MSAPAANMNGLPVSTIAIQSSSSRRATTACADSKALRPKTVGLRVVLAVVHRHERERPEACVDAIELELGLHWRFSQSTAAPMPMPMQSAVRP